MMTIGFKQVALDLRQLDPVEFADEFEAAEKAKERLLSQIPACELDSEDEADCYMQYGKFPCYIQIIT